MSKAPKIPRLVTPLTLQRKRARIADKKKTIAKAKADSAEYQRPLATWFKEQRECHGESLAKTRSRLSAAASEPSVAAWSTTTSFIALLSFCYDTSFD